MRIPLLRVGGSHLLPGFLIVILFHYEELGCLLNGMVRLEPSCW